MGIYKFVRMICDRCGDIKEYVQPAENEPIDVMLGWTTIEIPFEPLKTLPESREELVKRRTKTLCTRCGMDLNIIRRRHTEEIVRWYEKDER